MSITKRALGFAKNTGTSAQDASKTLAHGGTKFAHAVLFAKTKIADIQVENMKLNNTILVEQIKQESLKLKLAHIRRANARLRA